MSPRQKPASHPPSHLPPMPAPWSAAAFGCLVLVLVAGCAPLATPQQAATAPAAESGGQAPATDQQLPERSAADPYASFRAYGRTEARIIWNQARRRAQPDSKDAAGFAEYQQFRSYADQRAAQARTEFFKGRYNRSRARLPENVGQWRAEPDIANPGPDLANFPNSAFTLPQGRAYVELSPFTYYGTAKSSPAQYNAEFLLRYGLTDDIELRLFGNGVSWSGGSNSTWGFSPIAFDTKLQLWTEKPDYYLPAAGFEAYIQTQWLGTAVFNGGVQPSFTFNFDQSLPFEIDLEYNLGTTRVQDAAGTNRWELSFQWALQRDLFEKNFAVFIHGFYNAMTLPRLPNAQIVFGTDSGKMKQNAVGAGFIWTLNRRVAVYGQTSGGTTSFTPSLLSLMGFAVSF
jgi:hypothetical protein